MNADRWDAGSALMKAQNPEAWNVLMAVGKLTADNSAALAACRDAAAKTKRKQRCSRALKQVPECRCFRYPYGQPISIKDGETARMRIAKFAKPQWWNWIALVLAAMAMVTVVSVRADELPRARPEDLGFSASRLEYIDQFYSEKVKRGEMAGIVLLVARHGKIAHFSAVGYANSATRQPMKTDTLFRWYSMTKPLTATALMMLYEEGRFQLHDPVSKYIPE